MSAELEIILKNLDITETQKCAIRGFVKYKGVTGIGYNGYHGGGRIDETNPKGLVPGPGHVLTGNIGEREVMISAPGQRDVPANSRMDLAAVDFYTKRPDGSYERFTSNVLMDKHYTVLMKDKPYSMLVDNVDGAVKDLASPSDTYGLAGAEHRRLHEETKCKVEPKLSEGKTLKPLQPLA